MELSSPTHMVGKYWTHEDDCGVPGRHIHYGQNVVLPVPNELGPVLSELHAENERLRTTVLAYDDAIRQVAKHGKRWISDDVDLDVEDRRDG